MADLTLKGDKTLDITKVIEAGDDTVKVYHKIVDSQPADGDTVTFDEDDIVAYLTDLGDFGASKETKEYKFYHAKTFKVTTGQTDKDLQLTEALTLDAYKNIKNAFKANAYIVTAMFTKDGELIYVGIGQISEWTTSLKNRDQCTVQYTLSNTELENVTCTLPTATA